LEHYAHRKQRPSLWTRITGRKATPSSTTTVAQRNVNTAWYALAIAIGALGASYAAVPLYKVFCQTTGFGGTTQRVITDDNDGNNTMESYLQRTLGNLLPQGTAAKVHVWTDDDALEKLKHLRPATNADLITVRFDTTVPDNLPWSFQPVQLDVKVVPGETALSFFRVTNHSDQAITGVATYNVHPPKVGLYFQKVQCFCFEEQRLLPGETVDMPVFFFIDPEFLDDPQVSYVKSVTLSYTFFMTDKDDDYDDDDDDDDDEEEKDRKTQ
jgi:cytochrome c oxidase assembly protein subunit 11